MRRSGWMTYGLLVAAALAYCPMLFTGLDRWGRGDWDQFSFRFETPRTAILRDGQLPLWNPYVNGGNVLAAHPHCPAFSPWFLLTLALGAPLGLRVSVVLFVALGAVGTAALLRRWEVSPAGCVLGGVLLMMSGHFTMHIAEGHLEWCVLGLMPWVLWCLVRAADDRRFVVYGALLLASAVLYGSIYMVVVFVPLLGVWAVLEGVRTRSWRMVARAAVSIGLAVLLSGVALLPRAEFLRAHPRRTEAAERMAPSALRRALLDPRQADLFRATRDVRNPRTDELARFVPSSSDMRRPYETLKWYRLELTLQTTSEWADVGVGDYPHLWFFEGPDAPEKTPARLNSLPLAEEGLRVWGAKEGGEPVTGTATLYVQLPQRGHLEVTINQGVVGATKLTVTCNDRVVLDAVHGGMAWRGSPRTCFIRREAILDAGLPEDAGGNAPWYRLDAVLSSTSDWCRVEVVDCPYLFHVEPPQEEARSRQQQLTVPVAVTALDVKSRSPGKTQSTLRGLLYVRVPPNEDLHVALTQGPTGTSRLTLRSPQGEPLKTDCTRATQPGGCRTADYRLSGETISRGLTAEPEVPLRWRLDELGMTYNWQEYGCYVTWLGLAAALLGLVVSLGRRWPLSAVGLLAGLVAMGAALPVNVWGLWRLLPLYGSLQVPSRFLAAVVFVAAVCAGFGVDRLGRWAGRVGGVWTGRLLSGGIVLAVYVELAVLGWGLFAQIFVCPKRAVPSRPAGGFAQRFAADDVRYAAMYSAHCAYLSDNSGVLREYENIAVRRGKVRLAGEADYEGEAFLEGSRGEVEILRWTMSRVTAAVRSDAQDRLVLNQNYFPGWKVVCRDHHGKLQRRSAEPSPQGLVSTSVAAGDREVEFYYLPNSFILGAAVSGIALLGCLGSLVYDGRRSWQSWRLAESAEHFARRVGPLVRSKALRYVASAMALNVPWLICHPGWAPVEWPLVRSLAVNAVLFLAPGLPLVGVMIGRRWLSGFALLWAIAASTFVFIALLAATLLAGMPVDGDTLWTVFGGTWIVTNLGLLLNFAVGGPPGFGVRLQGKSAWLGWLAFAVVYLVFFAAACDVVPVMDDHDYETQGTAYGLLTRLQMTLLTDRGTDYCFAHPPLAHVYVAASLLYHGRKDELAHYDEAWKRVQGTEAGAHRAAVRQQELKALYARFRADTHLLPATRAPNVFLAAAAVALLAGWVARRTGLGWLGLLTAAAYATNPEVLVRSSYGGYFSISSFAAIQILLAVEGLVLDRSRSARAWCLLAGGFAGLANHKLLLLPVAVIVWELVRAGGRPTPRRVASALMHPVALGFAGGTAVFWAYGLAVKADVFWLEHFRHHLVDRIAHHNPLRYTDYPSVAGLWWEFCRHTGYLLLPLGVAALAMLCRTRPGEDTADDGQLPRLGLGGTAGLWAIWAVLTAVAFSLIDWRQTKHLMPLMLPLYLAPAVWAVRGRAVLRLVAVLFVVLLVWNLYAVLGLVSDFGSLSITPAW